MGKKGTAAKATQKDQKKAEKKKKTEQKMKDATFGLKNKNKSKVVQNKINQLKNSMNDPGSQRAAQENKARKAQKAAEEEARREMELMFKSVKKKDNDNQKHLQVEQKEEKKVVKVDAKVRLPQEHGVAHAGTHAHGDMRCLYLLATTGRRTDRNERQPRRRSSVPSVWLLGWLVAGTDASFLPL